ncbi:MAG: MBOAT family protein [Armatimonadia bacterium]|nr:MBOAT family protein [Armatimonadia bacterium]
MLFPTIEFGLFFVVVFAASWTLRSRPSGRKWLLIGASYFFYGCWDWRFTGLLAGCSLANYLGGLWLDATDDRRRRRLILVLGLVVNGGVLGFFKYYGFFTASALNFLASVGWSPNVALLEVILPVGISFFTFQGISYFVDVYRRQIEASRSLADIMLYISFFPQLVAGPIVRAAHFLPQLHKGPDPKAIDASRALLLIMGGLFKKTIIANYIGTELVDPVFQSPGDYGGADTLLAIYGWAVQVYCDFSAYSDIAIGVAELLGFHFPPNFDQPYRASSLREYWRRWHISLSTWLRDYIYFPLGGSRRGDLRTYINLFLVLLFGGLWHGADWTFVMWGAVHAAGLSMERLGRRVLPQREWPPWTYLIGLLATFHFVCIARIFFRSPSFDVAMECFRSLGDWAQGATMASPFVVGLIVAGLGIHFIPPRWSEAAGRGYARMPLAFQGATLGLLLVLLSVMAPEGVAPFIYFQF